ncbi:UDP-glucose 4-epimerase GalE [Candidatus Fukatsuia anoeciicola]|uniref:UDP-glucose 4-epimerase GalE n=1 Tax=Candidatus Fukatsuia anoeciicola TaxID=2994492 RepID=UPI0034639FAA
MVILVTGGTGYIGSHTVLKLLERGDNVVIIDNLSNSSAESLSRILTITGCTVTFYHVDILDRNSLKNIFSHHTIDVVMHFAGLKSVAESISHPIKYYQNNVIGSLILLKEMIAAGVKKFIFSSSATVYGKPKSVPLTENAQIGITSNPYGTSKFMVEQLLKDFSYTQSDYSIIILRYFNPLGAHVSGLIGEDPRGIPNNLLPYITQVATGKLTRLLVYGNDYSTRDGTGIRDYIHVMDLAEGHLSALDYITQNDTTKNLSFKVYNLGTGIGVSVFEMIHTFETISGKKIPYDIVARRPGDIAECWSDTKLAYRELGWQAKKSLDDMISDTWRWQQKNPHGYNK